MNQNKETVKYQVDTTVNSAQDDTNAEVMAQAAASLLNDNANHLNAVTLKRLATARSVAVNAFAARQAGGVNKNGNVLQWFGHDAYFGQHKALSASLMLGAVLLAFFVVQQLNNGHNTGAENQIGDAFLLAEELPPEAFADKGFGTWVVLKQD